MKTAIQLIGEARDRQLVSLARGPLNGADMFNQGELPLAACCYASSVREMVQRGVKTCAGFPAPEPWPFAPEFWRPGTATEMLVRAGVYIAAEIDRLQRMGGAS